jgi:hypothetical protein
MRLDEARLQGSRVSTTSFRSEALASGARMDVMFCPKAARSRKTSLIRRISDLGLGIADPSTKKEATILAITSMSAAAHTPPGVAKSSASGGAFVGLRWRFGSARSDWKIPAAASPQPTPSGSSASSPTMSTSRSTPPARASRRSLWRSPTRFASGARSDWSLLPGAEPGCKKPSSNTFGDRARCRAARPSRAGLWPGVVAFAALAIARPPESGTGSSPRPSPRASCDPSTLAIGTLPASP